MKVRRALVAVAAGMILATAGAGYSAPMHRYQENDRQVHTARLGENGTSGTAGQGEVGKKRLLAAVRGDGAAPASTLDRR